MSIEDKIQSSVKSIFNNIEHKKKELNIIKADIQRIMDESRQELLLIKREIEAKKLNFEVDEQKHKERLDRQTQDFIREKESEMRRFENRIEGLRAIAQSFIEEEIEKFKSLLENNINGQLSDAYINALFYADNRVWRLYKNQAHSSLKAAETIRGYGKENRELRRRVKDLEYLLSEYWSIDEEIGEKEDFENAEDDEDATYFFISDEEYRNLSRVERNQLALDRYLRRRHSKRWIGRMYERYIGYLKEKEHYDVQYRGINLGLKDGGIDLICKKNGIAEVIQCKNWRQDSVIYEKHICQLYGATKFYALTNSQFDGPTLFDELEDIDWGNATPIFATTTQLDKHAHEVANRLGITIFYKEMDKQYPQIKCNINGRGEKIYHLPFDQMYDKVKINKPGECYVRTVAEAEKLGFRRAFRWHSTE